MLKSRLLKCKQKQNVNMLYYIIIYCQCLIFVVMKLHGQYNMSHVFISVSKFHQVLGQTLCNGGYS